MKNIHNNGSSMKKFWMAWITLVTIIGFSAGAYIYIDYKNQQNHYHEVKKYCAKTAMKGAEQESIYVNDIKTAYSYKYANCISSH